MLERDSSHTAKRKPRGHEGRHWIAVTTSQERSMSMENWNKKESGLFLRTCGGRITLLGSFFPTVKFVFNYRPPEMNKSMWTAQNPQVGEIHYNHLRKLTDKLVTKILLESQWLDWNEYKMKIFILFFACLFVLVHRWWEAGFLKSFICWQV